MRAFCIQKEVNPLLVYKACMMALCFWTQQPKQLMTCRSARKVIWATSAGTSWNSCSALLCHSASTESPQTLLTLSLLIIAIIIIIITLKQIRCCASYKGGSSPIAAEFWPLVLTMASECSANGEHQQGLVWSFWRSGTHWFILISILCWYAMPLGCDYQRSYNDF